jgi:hypothetical protein
MSLEGAIATTRESVVAILCYRITNAQTNEVQCSWGSGFCIVANQYVLTAFHILNGGQPRDPQDKFLVFVVPGNGPQAFHFPVVGFPLERQDVDFAVLEIGPCTTNDVQLPELPVSFGAHVDGSHVVTVGYPAPVIVGLNLDAQGKFTGGNFFLKSHANEGIIAAQYPMGPTNLQMYEFNVGWHIGESGGPVVRTGDQIAAITIMQHYRNIQAPHGTEPGPRRGCALSVIQNDLATLGATTI